MVGAMTQRPFHFLQSRAVAAAAQVVGLALVLYAVVVAVREPGSN